MCEGPEEILIRFDTNHPLQDPHFPTLSGSVPTLHALVSFVTVIINSTIVTVRLTVVIHIVQEKRNL